MTKFCAVRFCQRIIRVFHLAYLALAAHTHTRTHCRFDKFLSWRNINKIRSSIIAKPIDCQMDDIQWHIHTEIDTSLQFVRCTKRTMTHVTFLPNRKIFIIYCFQCWCCCCDRTKTSNPPWLCLSVCVSVREVKCESIENKYVCFRSSCSRCCATSKLVCTECTRRHNRFDLWLEGDGEWVRIFIWTR